MSGEGMALDFLAALQGPREGAPSAAAQRGPRLGTVDASYGGSGAARVIFDGESVAGLRTYVALAPVRAGDRVVLLPVGHSFVVLGGVATGVPGSGLPPGTSLEGHWTAAPSGFLLEDGSVVLRATYPALFAVLGTRYNTGGETSLQFRLPDSRGRVAVAKSASGAFGTLGGKTGAETHTLTTAQIPSHTHPNPAAGQYWVGGGAAIFAAGGTYSATLSTATGSSAGGGGAHNNIQPSIVVTRVIKT